MAHFSDPSEDLPSHYIRTQQNKIDIIYLKAAIIIFYGQTQRKKYKNKD